MFGPETTRRSGFGVVTHPVPIGRVLVCQRGAARILTVSSHSDTDLLVSRAKAGDENAANQLLLRHRGRLRKMVGARLNRRVIARVDPSDVVQETLLIAHRRLPEYLKEAAVPFEVWLRQLAREQLIVVNRKHLVAGKRSVSREVNPDILLSDDSVTMLVDRLFHSDASPHARVVKAELRARVQAALAELSETD